jgi:hypothetical protein
MANASIELPVVVQKAYEFSIWLIRKVENFRDHTVSASATAWCRAFWICSCGWWMPPTAGTSSGC